MKSIMKLLPWKLGLLLSVATLILLIIFNFYGLYTNKFYFFKLDNYLLPLLTIIHFAFLYVLWFKIREDEVTDLPMRYLEYGLYAIIPIYVYKLIDTFAILLSAGEFESYAIPGTFLPIGIFMLLLYLFLIGLTFLSFQYRRVLVGTYNFDEINRHIDSWE
ncbi:hypothetical protein FK220_012315 [Flavobacteriaceae bacterium TP-CH-4]|uniref:Uncharacterized protein n=1 Tax=Pelagihabitans pacificus TaxID=2696054 RepID=A0A967AW09_9FLAO|nr:hypothetical protein [Pelagihabitans pacificus]NHF60133.1 hypothetical protein [Pelagihabitans pacificus]